MASAASASENQSWLQSQPARVSSAALILENQTGEVLIVKASYKNYWTFPGGIIEADESPRQAAIREVREEIGIAISPDTIKFVAVVDRQSDVAHTYQFIFEAPLNEAMIRQVKLQAEEIDDWVLATRDDTLKADRVYSQALQDWANGMTGYRERVFASNG